MVRPRFFSFAASARRLRGDIAGAVAVIGALSLTVLVGMGAFAVEASQGYAADTANQRIADMAALAGALAYNVNSSSSEMTATAKAVVTAQGLPAGAATVALVTDAATAKQLVQVSVTTAVPLALGRVFTSALSYDVTAVGSATTTATTTSAPPCIATLSSTPAYGITMSGGTSITAPGCAINSNAGVTAPWGTYITGKQINAGKAVNNPGGGITTSPSAGNILQNKANAAADWMKDSSSMMVLLCQLNKQSGVTDPDYADGNTICTDPKNSATTPSGSGGGNWDLTYSPKSAGGIYAYQTADYSCNYVVPAGTYNIGTLNVNGGCQISFASGSVLKFDAINMSGSGMTIGDGDVTVVGTFGFNSGSIINIGNGNHNFGPLAVTGGRQLNIGTGNLTVRGPITMDGGSYIRANIGVGNIVTITGSGSPATAINVGGGSYLCFTANCAAPTAATGTFTANGHVYSSGGSTIIFPKAATHIIGGDLSLNGNSTFGAGSYIVNGNFTNNTGGTMSGVDVSFILKGTFTLSGGTSLDLAAPGAGSSYGVPGLLIATKSSAATTIGGGSNNKYAGLIYAPKSDMTISGGGSISANGSACLMMILNTLTLTGGGTITNGSCSSLSGSSSSTASVGLFK